MDVKTLMIGDWVMQDDNLCNERKCRVMGIFDHCVVEVAGEKVPLHESHIKPIPLTIEILLKNGWKCYNTYRQFSCSNVPFELRGLDDGGFTMQVEADEFGGCTFLFIQYIYQLQHALKLCGM